MEIQWLLYIVTIDNCIISSKTNGSSIYGIRITNNGTLTVSNSSINIQGERVVTPLYGISNETQNDIFIDNTDINVMGEINER